MRWLVLACLWTWCHPVPATATPLACAPTDAPEAVACTSALPVHLPCSGVLVPVADLLTAQTWRLDLAHCEAMRALDAEESAGAVKAMESRWRAAEARGDAHAAELVRVRGEATGASGPGWGWVVGAGAVGVAVGVVVGVLVGR